MKKDILILLMLIGRMANAQTNVTVDATHIVKQLNGHENGINLNYLMDDAFISPAPATSLATSLNNMHVKMLRYPGGEKSDNYLWSVAPWTSSLPRMALKDAAYFWPTGDTNFIDINDPEKKCKAKVLDFDEFMTVCAATGAEPLIVVAYDAMYNTLPGSGIPTKSELITNAREWVRYANITHSCNIKYWMIGNESWNDPTYNGTTTPAQYALDIADFATAMKAIDPTIKIVANGRNDWWPTLLSSATVSNIDLLAVSHYPTYNYLNGYEYYRNNNVDLVGDIQSAINSIYQYAPISDTGRIKVLASEYNSIDWSGNWDSNNDLGHALCNFQMLGDMISLPKLETACMWNTRWVDNVTNPQSLYDAIDANGHMNANGTALKIWGETLLNNLVDASSSSTSIRSFASSDATGNLNIVLLNKENTNAAISLNLQNFAADINGSVSVFAGQDVNDKFPSYTKTDTINAISDIQTLVLPHNSVTVLKLHTLPGTSVAKVYNTISQLSIIPNPANETVNALFAINKAMPVEVHIYSIDGRILWQKKMQAQKGPNKFELKHELPAGSYILSILTQTKHTIQFQVK
ncbi:MAG: T9SS type A sorting domain-containing protein [Sphingobacteriales bacterium]|nr:MAG: T9SS type A sorting domain-containing protein [Sphingobacteriales bacterium]